MRSRRRSEARAANRCVRYGQILGHCLHCLELLGVIFPDNSVDRCTRAAPLSSAPRPLASEPSSVVLISSSAAPPCGPQSPVAGILRPAVPSRVCNRSRIGGVADDVVVVRSPPSGPEMSQTSQAHARRIGMDVSRDTCRIRRKRKFRSKYSPLVCPFLSPFRTFLLRCVFWMLAT